MPRRFRNFEALHRRCEKEAGVVALSSHYAPLPALPKKRFVLNSLDGAFVEARRAALFVGWKPRCPLAPVQAWY